MKKLAAGSLAVLLILSNVAVPLAAPIVQTAVTVKSVSKAAAIEIFGGTMRKWPNGNRMTIIIQDPEAIANKFFSLKMGIPHNQFISIINKNLNDGADIKIVDNASQVMIAVASTPNSAGIYGTSQYIENVKGVRLLEIE